MPSPSASTMPLAKGDISHASGQVLDLKVKMHSRMMITLCWMAEDLSSLATFCALNQTWNVASALLNSAFAASSSTCESKYKIAAMQSGTQIGLPGVLADAQEVDNK